MIMGLYKNGILHLSNLRLRTHPLTIIYILPTKSTRELKIQYPQRAIQQGETVNIWVTYYTDQVGIFNKIIPIYNSSSNEPVNLLLTGNILSISSNAVLACPTVNQNTGPTSLFEEPENKYVLQAKVIDKLTRKRIGNAKVDLIKNGEVKYEVVTPEDGTFKGEVNAGDYQINTTAEGY